MRQLFVPKIKHRVFDVVLGDNQFFAKRFPIGSLCQFEQFFAVSVDALLHAKSLGASQQLPAQRLNRFCILRFDGQKPVTNQHAKAQSISDSIIQTTWLRWACKLLIGYWLKRIEHLKQFIDRRSRVFVDPLLFPKMGITIEVLLLLGFHRPEHSQGHYESQVDEDESRQSNEHPCYF